MKGNKVPVSELVRRSTGDEIWVVINGEVYEYVFPGEIAEL